MLGRMDRVAIVTGGSRGVGRRVARRLARRGFAVVVGYAHDQRDADGAVDEILAAGGCAVAIRADVTDALDVQRLFEETIEAFGGVGLVVHAAPGDRGIVEAEAARHVAREGAVVGPERAQE
jgi:3-oxoacyl-[acyl-carrier protein] reductase